MTDTDKAAALQEIGKSAAESIAEMVARLALDWDRLEELRADRDGGAMIAGGSDAEELAELEAIAGDCEHADEARERILEDALSVSVRSDWEDRHDFRDAMPAEYKIDLSTGGPATRIIGELDRNGEPKSARLQVQDWFTPWTDYTGDACSDDDLLTYAGCFYFAAE